MLKISILTAFMLPLLLFISSRDEGSPNASSAANTSPSGQGQSGTLQKMIVASGSATMDLDLSRINGITSTTGRLETAPRENFRSCILQLRRTLSFRFSFLTMCYGERSRVR